MQLIDAGYEQSGPRHPVLIRRSRFLWCGRPACNTQPRGLMTRLTICHIIGIRLNFSNAFPVMKMLNLQSESSPRWLRQVEEHLDEVLIDHAHCEKKAAGVAMNLLFAYVDNEPLCRAMTEIVNEELDHFHQVLELLKQRDIRFRRLKPGPYGRKLNDLVSRQEPQRAVDRLLVAALIEARSCERFCLLRDHLTDSKLCEFYGSLFKSEARHHSTYVQLAKSFADEERVRTRLEELARDEAEILAEGCPLPRMHS